MPYYDFMHVFSSFFPSLHHYRSAGEPICYHLYVVALDGIMLGPEVLCMQWIFVSSFIM